MRPRRDRGRAAARDGVEVIALWPGDAIDSATGRPIPRGNLVVTGERRPSLEDIIARAVARGASIRTATADEARALRAGRQA